MVSRTLILLVSLPIFSSTLTRQSRRSSLLLTHATSRSASLSYPPEDVPGPKPLPAWISAYEEAKRNNLIPSIKPAVLVNGEPAYPSYSESALQNQSDVCSWTVSKCSPPSEILHAPKGKYGISFDDGPQGPTSRLLKFLLKNNQTATHFMIGSRILDNPELLQQAVNQNHDHIAVHTWSHPYMTTMNDYQVLGEIGWTLQIIHDIVGLLPAFWRPPYGDIDNRVRAISEHVFGLKTVLWSTDSDDWCLSDPVSPGSECPTGSGPQTLDELTHWLEKQLSPQVPGDKKFQEEGIICLEHELSNRTVEGFIRTYPLTKKFAWDTQPIPDLFGMQWYQNPKPNPSELGILPLISNGSDTQAPSPDLAVANNQTILSQDTQTPIPNKISSSDHLFVKIPFSLFSLYITVLFLMLFV